MTPDPSITIPMRPSPAAPRQTRRPYQIPRTPGLLRAIIGDRLAHLKTLHPDSWEYIRGMQRVAELESELHALDTAAMAAQAQGAA